MNTTHGMSAAQAAQQGNRDSGGRYTEAAHTDPGSAVLTTEEVGTRRMIEAMVRGGELAPAALDMTPRDALWQHAEANAMTLREREDFYAHAGLQLQMAPAMLIEGDLIDLEPVIREFGDSSIDDEDLQVAMYELATIEKVEVDAGGAMILFTDQGTWGVPADYQLDMVLGMGRCETCGEVVNSEGICEECSR